jgi:hypothetical protein
VGLRLSVIKEIANGLGKVHKVMEPNVWELVPYSGPVPRPVGSGRRITHEHLRRAADAWHAAKADREPVRRAVADALFVSLPQASVYIRRARQAGMIPSLVEARGV